MVNRCWWDSHTFDHTPVFLPVKYDDKRDAFLAVGTFCSFACVKAYNQDGRSASSALNATLISLLHKRMCGCIRHIPTAPHFSCLEAYGGNMSIEEFRRGSETEYTGTAPEVSFRHEEFKPKVKADRALQCIREADVSNQPLKLMRKTPLNPREGAVNDGGNLLKKMGIVAK